MHNYVSHIWISTSIQNFQLHNYYDLHKTEETQQIKCENKRKRVGNTTYNKICKFLQNMHSETSNVSHGIEKREYKMQVNNGCREVLKCARNTTKKKTTPSNRHFLSSVTSSTVFTFDRKQSSANITKKVIKNVPATHSNNYG